MDTINELLGFAVLSGPLWLIIVVSAIAVLVGIRISMAGNSGSTKWITRLGVIVLAFLVLFGDELVGRAYLGYLCAHNAGVKVYKPVKLPARYWDEKGNATFIVGHGSLDTSILPSYDTKAKVLPHSGWPRIEIFSFQYLDKETDEVVGEMSDYRFLGGWLVKYFTPDGRGGPSCDRPELQDSKGIILSIFQPAKDQDN